jgi:hypothetical protein
MRNVLRLAALLALASQIEVAVAARQLAPALQYAQLPLAFEANQGQADPSIDFLARGAGYQIALAADSIRLALPSTTSASPQVVAMRFVGANSRVVGQGIEPLESKTNYLLGDDPSTYLIDIPNYGRIRFDGVYPGIDVVYYGRQRELEYDLIVAPGADPGDVRLSMDGADDLSIDDVGDLVLSIGSRRVKLQRPLVYQSEGQHQRTIDSAFRLVAGKEVAIAIGEYDASKPLVIDPVVSYASFLGGSGDDYGMAVAVDGSGNAYIAGFTTSTGFPTRSPYLNRMPSGSTVDVFISKVNAAGTALVYSTYLGLSSSLVGGVGVDGAGSAFVAGNNTIVKLTPAGNALSYKKVYTGLSVYGMAVDAAGNVYAACVAGSTFPTTPGAYQPAARGSADPLVMKLDPSGNTSYATFLGGSSGEGVGGIAIDASGNAYVAGTTSSTDFPVVNAYQATAQGSSDGFVAKLNPTGTALLSSTRLGGADIDVIEAIAVDSGGSAYVTGHTKSVNYPTLNAVQPTKPSQAAFPSAFVTKLSATGSALVYSTYLSGGGSPNGNHNTLGDRGYAIGVDAAGHAFVTGLAQSPGFPLVAPIAGPLSNTQEGQFVSKVSADGRVLLYSTIIGISEQVAQVAPYNTEYDAGYGIAVDAKGDAYSTGNAQNRGAGYLVSFPATSGAVQTRYGGGWTDAVFSKLTTGPMLTAALATSTASIDSGQTVALTATVGYAPGGSGGALTGDVLFFDGTNPIASAPISNNLATVSITPAVGIHRLNAVYRPGGGAEAVSPISYVAVNPTAQCN